MRITYKAFDSKMASREKLFKAALEFANKLDPQQLINITHSEDRDNIVITIWYFTDEPERGADVRGKSAVPLKQEGPRPAAPTAPGTAPLPPPVATKPTFPGLISRKIRRPEPETHHGLPPEPEEG